LTAMGNGGGTWYRPGTAGHSWERT